ncbi:MAG TPA: exodeoxyribonuclease VII small subunit [Candidatus Faecaligallichristensenella faecipullorum]|mgnify:FL=1|nr:exodeoxyribonuclease VII small subunit [Candidatus Faecaligallichristensenella faecipullorum]
MAARKKGEVKTFEEGMALLSQVVDQLENGGLSLEASFEAYEKGMALGRQLEDMLDKGEKRMRQLTEKNGEVTEEPLEEVEL